MQSALRSAARRAAGTASRRGVATTTEAEREWVSSLVQREVRAQMLAAEERDELQRSREAERRARLRAFELELEAPWKELRAWRKGLWMGDFSCFAGGVIGTLIILQR